MNLSQRPAEECETWVRVGGCCNGCNHSYKQKSITLRSYYPWETPIMTLEAALGYERVSFHLILFPSQTFNGWGREREGWQPRWAYSLDRSRVVRNNEHPKCLCLSIIWQCSSSRGHVSSRLQKISLKFYFLEIDFIPKNT